MVARLNDRLDSPVAVPFRAGKNAGDESRKRES